MNVDKQAIIVFRQGAQLERIVQSVFENSLYSGRPIQIINSYEQFMGQLKSERHICAIANADADPQLITLLDEETEDTQFPVLFLTDDLDRLPKQNNKHAGKYDIVLRSWVNRHTLPKFIASCVHDHAIRYRVRQQDSASQISTRLLALIGHEIKVPLETLRVTQANLIDMEMSDQAKLVASQSERAIAYICEYIENFIEHARLEKGDAASFEEEFCVGKLVREVVDLVLPKAQIKGITIDIEMGEGERVYAFGDKKRLRQVLINILSNAVRYTDEGAVSIIVEANEGLRFTIEDTGVGMAPSRLEEVFESDVDRVMSSNGCARAGGLGIGVALSRKLVEALRGEILAESEVDVGTEVTITLPFRIRFGKTVGYQSRTAVAN